MRSWLYNRVRDSLFFVLYLCFYPSLGGATAMISPSPQEWHRHPTSPVRRSLLLSPLTLSTTVAAVDTPPTSLLSTSFVSTAYPKRELTNSITASRDTNVSPNEVKASLRSAPPTFLRRTTANFFQTSMGILSTPNDTSLRFFNMLRIRPTRLSNQASPPPSLPSLNRPPPPAV